MSDDAIAVAVRVRPVSKTELKKGLSDQWTVVKKEIFLNSEQNSGEVFAFDYILGTDANNNDLYTVVKPLVQSALSGVNATIFAYGQTSSGKTHSIMGSREEQGIIPRAVRDIFATIQNNPDNKYVLRVSYLEIYNEKINDLLNVNNRDIKIREDSGGNIFVNSEEIIVIEEAQMLEVIQRGNKRRQIGETKMNDRSSRSHVLCDITIESSEIDDEDGAVKVSHLYIVDLAGSERISQTKATGTRMNEGVLINLSLSSLINVIMQLSSGTKYINYRDSKLTRMLSNALGGNCRTLIICTITPVSIDDSLSTLRFAQRAKTIKTKPRINEMRSDQSMIKKLQKREKQLTEELQREKQNNMKNLDMRMKLEAEVEEIRSKFVTGKAKSKSRLPSRRHTMAVAQNRALLPVLEVPELLTEPETPPAIYTKVKVEDSALNTLSEQRITDFENDRKDYKELYAQTLQKCHDLELKYKHLDTSYATWKEFDHNELEVEVEARTLALTEQNQELKATKLVLEAEIDITKSSLMNKYEQRCRELLNRIAELENALTRKNAAPELAHDCDPQTQASIRLIEGRSRYLWEEELGEKEASRLSLRRSCSDPQLATLQKDLPNKLFQDISVTLRKLCSVIISDEDSDTDSSGGRSRVRNSFANKLWSIADGNPKDAPERLNALLMEQRADANMGKQVCIRGEDETGTDEVAVRLQKVSDLELQLAAANEQENCLIKKLEEQILKDSQHREELELEIQSLTEKCGSYEEEKTLAINQQKIVNEEKLKLEQCVHMLQNKFSDMIEEHELFMSQVQAKSLAESRALQAETEKVKIFEMEKQHWDRQLKEQCLDLEAIKNQVKLLQGQFDDANSEKLQFAAEAKCLAEQIATLEADLKRSQEYEQSLIAEYKELRDNQAVAQSNLQHFQEEIMKNDEVVEMLSTRNREHLQVIKDLQQQLRDLEKLTNEQADSDIQNINHAILKDKSERIQQLEEELKEIAYRSKMEAERLALTMQDSEEEIQALEKTVQELKAQLMNAENERLQKKPSIDDSEELRESIRKLQEDLQGTTNVLAEREDALLMLENDLQQAKQSLKTERLAKDALVRQFQENSTPLQVKELINNLEEELKEWERKGEQFIIKNKALSAENEKINCQVASSEQLISNLNNELDALKKHQEAVSQLNAELSHDGEELREKNRELRELLRKQEEQHLNVQSEQAALKTPIGPINDCKTCASSVDKLEESIKIWERKEEEYITIREDLRNQNEKLSNEIATSEALIQTLRKELIVNSSKHEENQTIIDTLQTELNATKASRTAAENNPQHMEEEMNKWKTKLEESQSAREAMNTKCKTYEDVISRLEEDLKEWKTKGEGLTVMNKARDEESVILSNKLSCAEKDVKSLQDEIEILQKRQEEEVSRLRNECKLLTKNWNASRESIQLVKTSLAKEHAKELAGRQMDIQKLQEDLAQQKAREDKLSKVHCDLKRDYASLKCLNEEQKWQIVATNKKIKQMEEVDREPIGKHNTQLENELTSLKDKMGKMKLEYLSLEQSQKSKALMNAEIIQQLRQQSNSDKENQPTANNVSREDQIKAYREECNNLKSDLQEMQERVKQLSTAKSEIEAEVVSVKEKFSRAQHELEQERQNRRMSSAQSQQELYLHMNRYRDERNKLRIELENANAILKQSQSAEEFQKQRKDLLLMSDRNKYRKDRIDALTKENEELRNQSKDQQGDFQEQIEKLKMFHGLELKKLNDKLRYYVPDKYDPEQIIYDQKIASQSTKVLQVITPITELLAKFNAEERWTKKPLGLCIECEGKLKLTGKFVEFSRGSKNSNLVEMAAFLKTKNLENLYDSKASLDPLLAGTLEENLKLHVRTKLESYSAQIESVQKSLSKCYSHFTDIQEGFGYTRREFNVRNSSEVENCKACGSVSLAFELTITLEEYLSYNIRIIESYQRRRNPVDFLGLNVDQLDAKLAALVKRFNDSNALQKLCDLEERYARLKKISHLQECDLQKMKQALIRENYEINLKTTPIVIAKRSTASRDEASADVLCFQYENNPRPVFDRHRDREHTGRKSLGGRIPRHLDLVFGHSEDMGESSKRRSKE